MRILERLGIQTSSSMSKFDRSVFVNLKAVSYFFGFTWLGFLSRNYWGLVRLIFEKNPFEFWREV